MHSVYDVVGDFKSTRTDSVIKIINVFREESVLLQFQSNAGPLQKAENQSGMIDAFVRCSGKDDFIGKVDKS